MRNAPGRRCLLAVSLAVVLAAAMPRVAPAGGPPTGTLVVSVVEGRHHRAIPFATVALPDEKRGGLTDTDGWSMIPRLQAGRHLVKVQSLGCIPFRDSVLVHAHEIDTLRVVLREVVIHEDPFLLLPPPPGSTDTTYRLLPTTPRRKDTGTVLVSRTGR